MKKLYAALFIIALIMLLIPFSMWAQTTNIEQTSPAISYKPPISRIKQVITKKKNTKQDTVITGKGCGGLKYVLDADNDGFYTGYVKGQCASPGAGWVLLTNQIAGDCNDNDASVHQIATWVVDNDKDGYYTGEAVTQCSSPGAGWIVQTNQQPGDCDENDASANLATTSWVIDNDKDGYYTGDLIIQCHSPGNGYIRYSNQHFGDCDDNNASVHQVATWIVDNDNDGYYAGDAVTQCDSPGAEWIVQTNQQPGDCDDNNASVHQVANWVLDNDLDGYYTGDVVTQCSSPGARWVVQTNQQPGDCDDNNHEVNPANEWVLDVDGDGFYSGEPITQCYYPGGDWVLLQNSNERPGDCNDYNYTINPATTWILDADNDGYYSADPVTQCTSPGTGYVIKTNQQAGDCDDNNASVHQQSTWVLDADGDGYYTDDPVMQCASPGSGYVIQTDQEKPGDCDDDDPLTNPETLWVHDADGDGYYSDSVNSCEVFKDGWHKWNENFKSGDCNDNDASINPSTIWVLDADNDGYYSGNRITTCTFLGTGYVILTNQKPGDCDDNNSAVHPDAIEICGNGIDDNCNGKIDEGCAIKNVQIFALDKSIIEGNKNARLMKFQVKLNKKPENIVTVNYTTQDGSATTGSDYTAQSGTISFQPGVKSAVIGVQIQGDKTPEPNETFTILLSNAVNGTITNATGTGTILNDDGGTALKAVAKNEEVKIEAQQSFQLQPNPAINNAYVNLKGYTGTVIIQLSDFTGKRLQQYKLQAEKIAQQPINVSAYTNGIYLVTVIDEKGNRQTKKLIIIK